MRPAIWDKRTILRTCLLLLILGTACTLTPTPSPAPTASPSPPALTPYLTPTPDPTAAPTPAPLPPQPTLPPQPSSTPFLYTVVANDTLLGIALRYGLTLPDLLAANPGLDPQFLSIGAKIAIPLGENPGAPLPAASTPEPAILAPAPVCYPAADGSAWCFLLAENTLPYALENLSAQITLYGPAGAVLAAETAIPLLDQLSPGARLPLVAYFPPPAGTFTAAAAQLLTALPVQSPGTRYLPLTLTLAGQTISENGLSATLTGALTLDPTSAGTPAATIWVLAIAYDAAGNPAGLRRWEHTSPLPQGTSLPFEITVYSAGPPLARVDILAEARP